MQTLIYESLNGIITQFSPASGPFVFDSVSGVSGLSSEAQTVQPAGLDGELFFGSLSEAREITLNVHVEGKDLASLYLNRTQLIKSVSSSDNHNGRLGKLRYVNDSGAWWAPAYVYQNPNDRGKRKGLFIPMQIVFRCPDPFWRAELATIDRMAYLSGGFQFVLKIPAVTSAMPGIKFGSKGYKIKLVNNGNQPAPAEIIITGPAKNPTIRNITTGESMRIKRDLQINDVLTINTERGNKQVSILTALGERTDAMGYIDAGSSFFQLQPGTNDLEYLSGNDSTSATVVIKMFDRFGGV